MGDLEMYDEHAIMVQRSSQYKAPAGIIFEASVVCGKRANKANVVWVSTTL